ncbi:MAG: hypothetical protein CMJ47_12715 [Planctomyces sp.]|nr:hypothetical protein [Planctomyces sp.]
MGGAERLRSQVNIGRGVGEDWFQLASKKRLVEPPSATTFIRTCFAHLGHQATKASPAAFRLA